MEIKLHEIKVRDLVENYKDSGEDGVTGYNGRLNIRPKYQREFVYDRKQRDAVIRTVQQGFPLNTMYWVDNGNDQYEVLDGQQRTISICQYYAGDFSIDDKYFHNLPADKQEQILDYTLMVYFCQGNDSEKLDWFKIVNVAGVVLSDQELRNAVYTGSWLTAAKTWFSKSQAPAYQIGKDYINAKLNRQGFLEVALDWISAGDIKGYMSKHQDDPNADELWSYYRRVIDWIDLKFIKKRPKLMKGVDWGKLYREHKDDQLDGQELEARIHELLMDDEILKQSGIYEYVLNGSEKALNLRAFTDQQKTVAYERQGGICPVCHKHYEIDEMEGDHDTPWSKGGKTTIENCVMLCKKDNREKSDD